MPDILAVVLALVCAAFVIGAYVSKRLWFSYWISRADTGFYVFYAGRAYRVFHADEGDEAAYALFRARAERMQKLHMGQTMAECDCDRPECREAGRCWAEVRRHREGS